MGERGEANEPDPADGAPPRGLEDWVARWLLGRCAPRDADVAMADLDEERRSRGRLRFWGQVLSVCTWGLLDRIRTGGLHPVQALRMAVRGLVKAPGTALTAALTLGVGLTAAVSLLGTFMGSFRPLPVPDGEDVVQLQLLDDRAERVAIHPDLLTQWRGPGAPLLGIGATRSASVTVVWPGHAARRASAAAVTPGTLEMLRVMPVRGRFFQEGVADADAVLLRADLWAELAPDGAEPLGSTVRMEGRTLTVVGIMPADFGFPEAQDVWTMLPIDSVAGSHQVVARLRPGDDADDVAAALTATLRGNTVGAESGGAPDQAAPQRVRILDYVGERGEGGEAVAFAALGVLVVLLLVVCTANASTLLMVRASERAATLAVHSALGATRAQVVLQLLLESGLVAGLGGLMGLGGGALVLRWSEAALSSHWGYYWMRMEMQPGVVVGTAVVVMICALVAGTLPVMQAIRTDIRDVLVSGGGRSGAAGSRRTVSGFVGLQVALSTTGLVLALILIQGFTRGDDLLEGLPVEKMALASMSLPPADSATHRQTVAALHQEMTALPGGRRGTVSTGIPGYGNAMAGLEIAGRTPDPETRMPTVGWTGADPAFLDTWELTLLAGRTLGSGDAAGAEPVALVTRSFVRRWLDGGDPLGRRIRLDGVGADEWIRIVGVVEDWYPDSGVTRADRVIVPLDQVSPARLSAGQLFLSARADGDPASLVPHLRAAIRNVDPELAPDRVETMTSLVAWLVRMPRAMGGFGAAGGVAGVLVAAIGLFGILSFRVKQGLPAVGIRMALGARRDQILTRVLGDAARSLAPWILMGLAAAFLMSPATVIFSFGAPYRAPGTYLMAGAVMVAVGVGAALIPALRAARLDPLSVLKGD